MSQKDTVVRPSYLYRRPDGRYGIQLRLGKQAASLYGRPLLRVSVRTADFREARRRLVDNLGWIMEVIQAPDLEAVGDILHQRLGIYIVDGAPESERRLAERLAFEHQVRNYISRAQERGYLFARQFEGFASRWVDFVNQNKFAEAELAKSRVRHAYETGRADENERSAKFGSWQKSPPLAQIDPVTLIERIVENEVAKRLGTPTFSQAASLTAFNEIPIPGVEKSTGKHLSDALAEFLEPVDPKRRHTTKGRSEAEPVVQFAIAFLEDPLLHEIKPADWKKLDEALPDIPKTKNIPAETAATLFGRYKYAEQNGWQDLTRITQKTLRSKYWGGLYKFLDWAAEKKFFLGPRPKFECIDPNNTASLPRDAFEDQELLALFSLPLFTGCRNRTHVWKPGKYFVQSAIYWGYLICALTGMRPGEVGQLKCADIRTDGQFYYFDLRPFDARNGRVAMKDLRNLKTNAAGRVVPIHPLLIELGLLDRMHELTEKEEKRLFPEWDVFVRKKDGEVRWSQPLSKSWQYVKKVLGFARADLSLYSTRHLMADWLDNEAIAQRTRDRILGHAGDVAGRYGRKGILDPEIAAKIEALEPSVIKEMRKILMGAKQRADAGELEVLKTF